MSQFSIKLQCPNPDCLYADNGIGQSICDRCQQPLTYRYLWAVGMAAAEIPIGTLVSCRYVVVRPQVWLDTQPGLPPDGMEVLPTEGLPDAARAYLHLYPQRLHLPELFSVYQPGGQQPIYLLDNVPLDRTGQLQPQLEGVWDSAPAVRQLNWLWQMFQLWQPLLTQGVATSLLTPENLHVEGWRLRLRELVPDGCLTLSQKQQQAQQAAAAPTLQLARVASGRLDGMARSACLPASTSLPCSSSPPSLQDLAEIWQRWVETAYPTIRPGLQQLCQFMRTADLNADAFLRITEQLNQMLLVQAAQLPLQIETAGATTTGPKRSHNEDACYPTLDLQNPAQNLDDLALPGVGMVCDGIGGHEGGEVASQLALRSLQLQLRTWLAEIQTLKEPLSPAIITDQLVGMVRVVNNLIAAQNDQQGRAQKQRMGTTLALAVQIPQTVSAFQGNTHELYVVHVGDSRAYWITPHACQLLTVDDDVATREIQTGQSFPSQVRHRADAVALTQALGTRDADRLKITVQRLVLDQSGVLLLCSDGLSDQGLVEQHWETLMLPVLQDRKSLKLAVQEWLGLANRQTGHDNASVVLMQCRISSGLHWFEPDCPSKSGLSATAQKAAGENAVPQDLTESAKALLYDEAETEAQQPQKAAVLPKRQATPATARSLDSWIAGLGMAAITFVLTALGLTIWREVAPNRFPTRLAPPQSMPESAPNSSVESSSP